MSEPSKYVPDSRNIYYHQLRYEDELQMMSRGAKRAAYKELVNALHVPTTWNAITGNPAGAKLRTRLYFAMAMVWTGIVCTMFSVLIAIRSGAYAYLLASAAFVALFLYGQATQTLTNIRLFAIMSDLAESLLNRRTAPSEKR